MDGRSYISEGASLGLLAVITWLLYHLAGSTQLSVWRWFLYWAAAGGTSSLLVASTNSLMPNQGMHKHQSSANLASFHARPPLSHRPAFPCLNHRDCFAASRDMGHLRSQRKLLPA